MSQVIERSLMLEVWRHHLRMRLWRHGTLSRRRHILIVVIVVVATAFATEVGGPFMLVRLSILRHVNVTSSKT